MSFGFERVSLSVRVAVGGLISGLLIVAVALVLTYLALDRELADRAKRELLGKRELIVHALKDVSSASELSQEASRIEDLLIGHEGLAFVAVGLSDGRALLQYPTAGTGTEMLIALAGAVAAPSVSVHSSAVQLRHSMPLRNGDGIGFVLNLERASDQALLGGFVRGAAIGVPLLMAVVGLGAWLTARAGLYPLKRFARLARSVSSDRLSARLDTEGLPLELRQLAEDINGMLERIDRGVARLSEFTADIAHEMRTPVSTLLGRTQVALSRQRDERALRSVLEDNVEELDRLARLISDMLFIARAENQSEALDLQPVSLSEEAHVVAEFLSTVAEERAITIRIAGEARVKADKELVRRAITNLLSNAIRHSVSPGTVTLEARCIGSGAQLCVTNLGSPIAQEDLPRVFERFVRLDRARSRTDGGVGLGLAIVKSIMDAHRGAATATSTQNGVTTFCLRFSESTS